MAIDTSKYSLKNLYKKARDIYQGATSNLKGNVQALTNPETRSNYLSGLGYSINNPSGSKMSITEAIKQSAPTVATDFGNLLRQGFTVPTRNEQGRLVAQPLTQVNKVIQPLLRGSANVGQTVGGGVTDIVSGGLRAFEPGLTNKLAGGLQALRGGSKIVATGTPLFTGVNTLNAFLPETSSIKRLSTGFLRGMGQTEGLSPETIQKNINLPIVGEFDPLVAAGQAVGFVKNPLNSRFFKLTESILPTRGGGAVKWLVSNATRGGIENIVLNLPDMQQNLTESQKAKWVIDNFGEGAVSELIGQGFFQGAGKLANTKVGKVGRKVATTGLDYTNKGLAKIFDQFSEIKRRMNTPVKTLEQDASGNFITRPMWQVMMRNQRGSVGGDTPDIFKGDIKPGDVIDPATGMKANLDQPTKGIEAVNDWNGKPLSIGDKASFVTKWGNAEGKIIGFKDTKLGKQAEIELPDYIWNRMRLLPAFSGQTKPKTVSIEVGNLNESGSQPTKGVETVRAKDVITYTDRLGKTTVGTVDHVGAMGLGSDQKVISVVDANGNKIKLSASELDSIQLVRKGVDTSRADKIDNYLLDTKDEFEKLRDSKELSQLNYYEHLRNKYQSGEITELEFEKRLKDAKITNKSLEKSRKAAERFNQLREVPTSQVPAPQTQPALIKGQTQELSSLYKVESDQSSNLSQSNYTTTPQPTKGIEAPTKEMFDTQSRKMVAQAEKTPSILQTEVQKPNKVSQTSASKKIIPPTREEVAASLQNKIDQFTQKVLGYSTETPKGGTKEASAYTKLLRKGQEAISTRVETGLGSENPLVRNAATAIQNFFRGAGMSPERAQASMQLRGGMGAANESAFNVMDSLYKTLGENKKSLERINAVLDPTLAKTKVNFKDLTPLEKQTYGLIREGFDLVHDTSYANGHITPELYAKNKGTYTPRLYEVTEMPAEVSKFVTQGKKLANDLYKSRKEVDQWKIENNLNDPVYSLGKRLAQVQTNTAIKQYTDFLASNPRFISDVEKPGFTKLSDSPAYGALSGKYVLNSAAEDLKGFFFANQSMQNIYDVFRAYDRLPIRQLQKKLLTVFNPTTNVGNIVSDQVFGFLTGVDPLTLNKNLVTFKNNKGLYKNLANYLRQQGVVGTDITRTDFVNKLGEIDSLGMGVKKNKIKTAVDKVTSFYGGTDDVYKVSAFKGLLDKGYSLEEATKRVADGFQNYANVGKFYDLWAKTPVVGSAFIKFQGDLIRIIKNGAVNNPLGLITFLGTLKGISYLSSKLSGETPEDRKTREDRFAAPKIPGLNISLAWQTPIGEINAARYISPFYANNDVTNVAKMLPFVPTIDTKKDVASNIAINANDPFLSTPLQLLVNRDFRGKPISDPNESKYQPSMATPQEKLLNQTKFAARAYTPPPVNSLIDVGSAMQGKPDMYGNVKTPGQAAARLAGIKIQQFGPQEAQAQREKDLYYQNLAQEKITNNINSIQNQYLKGEITQDQAIKRIENQQKQLQDAQIVSGVGIGLTPEKSFEKKRDLKLYDQINSDEAVAYYSKDIPPQSQSAYTNAIREDKLFSKISDIEQSETIPDQVKQETILKLVTQAGYSPEDYQYYSVAKQDNAIKSMYAVEEFSKLLSTPNVTQEQAYQWLINARRTVNGKQILTSGVIDDLVDQEIISYEDGKYLKKVDLDKQGNLKQTTTKKSQKKPKKISVRRVTPPKIKISGKKSSSTGKKLKVARIKTQLR